MEQKKRGITTKGLKMTVLILTVMWVAGRTLSRIIMGDMTPQELSAVTDPSSAMMISSTVVLLLELISGCAIPLLAALLLEGMEKTSDVRKYLLRVGILALVCEIPYDLLMTGKFFDLSHQNPVFGLLVCQLVLFFFRRFTRKAFGPALIGVAVSVAAVIWCELARIEFGLPLVFCTVALWLLRKDAMKRGIGAVLGVVLSIPVYPSLMVAPMGALALHFFNEEQGQYNRKLCYIALPVLLAVGACITMLF